MQGLFERVLGNLVRDGWASIVGGLTNVITLLGFLVPLLVLLTVGLEFPVALGGALVVGAVFHLIVAPALAERLHRVPHALGL